ncbi:ABC transporter permease [Devosia psychrophila]|uniref:Acriflavin resistance protein n=1 Tax=Devosia psychrophila TaxID=728005 RepID=A0A0F5PUU8_9HYPH|nr:ABC transporter permease subunit [Devosia psychrophila]KKC32161.1 acriflavin resistance protein [Devosia psychrophila]SFC35110.1 putative spermidine/putrescine transport system permease protein [Devosia psychrophila]
MTDSTSRPTRRRIPWDYLAVAPFVIFAVMFLFMPTLSLIGTAFTDRAGNFTFDNIGGLFTDQILAAYSISIRVSGASAILGALIGLAITLAIIRGRLPAPLRSAVMTFSGVASNFAGVPLAFAFIATLGRIGLVTIVLRDVFHLDLYRAGFSLFSFWGLTLTYLYFQIPLMMLTIAPAVDGLKKEWSEAAQMLGANQWQFWRYVGLPILWPSFLGTLSLLFANAFGAIATAWALTGSNLNIVTVLLYNQIRGDALQNPGLGAALALGMIVITSLANVIYLIVAKRAERWMK